MGLNSRSSVDPRWRKSSATPLYGYAISTIQIIDPNSTALGTDYDPWANTFADPSSVIYTGLAQIEYYRQPHPAPIPDAGITSVRSIRFTLIDDGPVSDIRKGFWVRITEADNQPDLMHYQFVVQSGLTLPLGFQRTIEATVDTGVFLG